MFSKRNTYKIVYGDESKFGFCMSMQLVSDVDLTKKKYQPFVQKIVDFALCEKDSASISSSLELVSLALGEVIDIDKFKCSPFNASKLSMENGVATYGTPNEPGSFSFTVGANGSTAVNESIVQEIAERYYYSNGHRIGGLHGTIKAIQFDHDIRVSTSKYTLRADCISISKILYISDGTASNEI